ncbi:cupredoxin domain-containing protein [Paenibacillus kobensis]|uniref:cupredoxin domain-containing protein n=1 Tax=Paenibacillus kobensis TaxID=59841 RepID=UPI000FD8A4EA|nr:cupredoxin domain-containing protein [Paenibacillus kobensis]
MNKWICTMALLMTIALVTAGCGGGDKETSSSPAAATASDDAGGGTTVTVDAKNFTFDQKEIKVKKGDKVTIKLVNSQGNHTLKIDGYDKEVKGNQSVTFTADKSGEFKYFCNMMCGGGHTEMTGKLIVE